MIFSKFWKFTLSVFDFSYFVICRKPQWKCVSKASKLPQKCGHEENRPSGCWSLLPRKLKSERMVSWRWYNAAATLHETVGMALIPIILLHLFQNYQNLICCLFLEVISICSFLLKIQRIRKNATEKKW